MAERAGMQVDDPLNACLYTVATGHYARMAEGLILSLREHGVEYDFVAFSDSDVKGASETIAVDPMSFPEVYFQKVALLRHMATMGYEYVVCVDCDVLCLRKFTIDRFSDLPCFAILEDDLEAPIKERNWNPRRRGREWYGSRLDDFVKLMLSKNQGMSRPIHGLNAGLFGVRSEFCDEFASWHEKVTEFRRSEEPGLVLAIHSMVGPIERLSIRKNSDLMLPVACDPQSVLRSGEAEYVSPFTDWATRDKPALAHFCFFGKQFVLDYAKTGGKGGHPVK